MIICLQTFKNMNVLKQKNSQCEGAKMKTYLFIIYNSDYFFFIASHIHIDVYSIWRSKIKPIVRQNMHSMPISYHLLCSSCFVWPSNYYSWWHCWVRHTKVQYSERRASLFRRKKTYIKLFLLFISKILLWRHV